MSYKNSNIHFPSFPKRKKRGNDTFKKKKNMAPILAECKRCQILYLPHIWLTTDLIEKRSTFLPNKLHKTTFDWRWNKRPSSVNPRLSDSDGAARSDWSAAGFRCRRGWPASASCLASVQNKATISTWRYGFYVIVQPSTTHTVSRGRCSRRGKRRHILCTWSLPLGGSSI